jgi:hypothetical protein
MKTTLLIVWSCAVMTAIHAQKTPKGIDEFERELFVKRVQLLTWVKHVFKNQYFFAANYEAENQMQLFGEAKRFLSLYGKTLDDHFFDISSFCPGTDYTDFEQIDEGIILNQELYALYHLDGDWVLQLRIGYGVNSMILNEWKNTDWSKWEDDPLQEQLDLLLWMLNE